MNENRNTETSSIFEALSKKSYLHFLKHVLALNGNLHFDIYINTKQYSEKLPIIFANFRV
jgi:hypothetical protein